MAKLYNLARMTTATTGTGTITLGSAVPSYVTFAAAGAQNGETVTYAIADGNNREVGRGVYTSSGTTLTRATILESTNNNLAINLSGNAEVFITAAAEDIANVNEINTFAASQIISVTDNSNAALRVTQLGTGLALRVEDSANPDASPFVVTADGNVGIGVSTPTARLEVYTNAASAVTMNMANTQGVWSYGVDASGNGTLYSNSAKSIIMSTSATERLRISDAGVTTITGTGIINSTSSNDALRINQLGSGAAIRVEDSANPDSSPFIVTAEGKVGIGEDVPLFHLQVAAPNASTQTNVGITSTNYTSDFKATYLQFSDASTTGTTYGITNANLGALLFQNTSNALIGTNGGTPLIFGTLSLERFRIASSGQWGIGGANYGTSGQAMLSGGASAAPSWGDVARPGVSNTFTANQVISVTDNSNAALRVTQLGTADAIRVEDSTNPDSSPFVISADGNVGIGTTDTTHPRVYISGAGSQWSTNNYGTNLIIGGGRNNAIGILDSTNANPWAVSNGANNLLFSQMPALGNTATAPTERLRIDSSGNVLLRSSAGLGYGTGAGGTVTQATSKTTAVTLNKPSGQITMNNAALAAAASVTFTLNNSLLTAQDTLIVNHSTTGGTSGAYLVETITVGAGTAVIRVTNITGGSLSEAAVINFNVIKGVTS